MMTISEYADKYNVTPATIYYHIKKGHIPAVLINSKYFIDERFPYPSKSSQVRALDLDAHSYVTVSAYAIMVGRCDETVRNWLREGLLPAERFGRRYMISKEAKRKEKVTPPEGYLSVDEYAASLFVSGSAVRRHVLRGRIPCIHIGKRVFIREGTPYPEHKKGGKSK